jgi:YesN/AraC family two-component response regulator
LLNSLLIIDDEKEVRNSLSTILEDEGYLVETAENGKNALQKCETTSFDLALVDINLPDIKGTELIQQLKHLQPRMITIIITGYPTVENAIKAVNEKSDGYILKPIKIPELLETITRRLNEKQSKYFRMYSEVEKSREQTESLEIDNPDDTSSNIQEENETPTPPINNSQEQNSAYIIPPGCEKHLGYLGERGVNIPIPDFCYTCPEILQCMRKKDT